MHDLRHHAAAQVFRNRLRNHRKLRERAVFSIVTTSLGYFLVRMVRPPLAKAWGRDEKPKIGTAARHATDFDPASRRHLKSATEGCPKNQ